MAFTRSSLLSHLLAIPGIIFPQKNYAKGHQRLAVFLLVAFFLPFSSRSQGWIEITPEGLHPVHFFSSFDFEDGTFEVFVWNSAGEATRGYRLNSSMLWDSIPAYYSYWCGPPSEREAYRLISIGRSSTDFRRAFSIFIRGGCITECYTHIYADTTGEVPTQNEVAFFDDFTCAGISAAVAVSPIDQQHVFVSFFDSLYSSSDGGQTFSGLSSLIPDMYDPFLHYLSLSPFDTNLIFVAGFEQLRNTYSLYKSSDMGLTWSSVLDENVSQLEFHPNDSSVVYAATDSGIFKSIDNGDTWTHLMAGGFGAIEVEKDSPDVVYAGGTYVGGTGGRLYRSTDGGSSWSIYNDTFTTLSIIGIYQVPLSDTLVVATTDAVFKVYASFVLDVEESPDVTFRFRLEQNYPNPFNPLTTIEFTIVDRPVPWTGSRPDNSRDGQSTILRVYDLLGREVATLVNEELPPGTYTRDWDAIGVSSGVYLYRLKAGAFSKLNRMILIK